MAQVVRRELGRQTGSLRRAHELSADSVLAGQCLIPAPEQVPIGRGAMDSVVILYALGDVPGGGTSRYSPGLRCFSGPILGGWS